MATDCSVRKGWPLAELRAVTAAFVKALAAEATRAQSEDAQKGQTTLRLKREAEATGEKHAKQRQSGLRKKARQGMEGELVRVISMREDAMPRPATCCGTRSPSFSMSTNCAAAEGGA